MDGTTPLAGQEIVLEGRRYPYQGSYRVIARTTTDAQGKFTIRPELDRNHRLRVVAPALALRSSTLRAYTLPAFELSFRAIRPGVVRLYQRYTVPTQRAPDGADALLSRPAPRRARDAPHRRRDRAHEGRPLHGGHHVPRARGLERRLPLRELLPRLAALRDGRSQAELPAPAARVLTHSVVRS